MQPDGLRFISPRQRLGRLELYFVVVDEYIYIVPHVISKEHIFLKTIIPSRKATKLYKADKENMQ
jgi:hypothetical protein